MVRVLALSPPARQVLFAACDLGVFDVIAASGEADLGAIAGAAGSSPHHTLLLLEACVELGLLRAGPGGGRGCSGGRGQHGGGRVIGDWCERG